MNLLEFHIKYGYYIDIKKTELGCSAYFPSNLNQSPQVLEDIIDYELYDNHIVYKDTFMKSKDIKVEKYVQRLYVVTDILIKMKQRDLCKDLILISDGITTHTSIISILPEPKRKEDQNLEEQLKKIYTDIWLNSSVLASADKLNIEEGCQTILNLIESDGIV